MHLALCTSGVLRAGGSRCFRSLLPAPSPAIPHIHGGGSLPLVALQKFLEGPSGWSGVAQCLLWPCKLGTGCLSPSLLPSVEWLRARPSLCAGLGAGPRGRVMVSGREAWAGGWMPSPTLSLFSAQQGQG